MFNKCDNGIAHNPASVLRQDGANAVCISAMTGEGIDEFLALLEKTVLAGKTRVTFRIPNSEQGALNILYKNATVEEVDYGADAVTVIATVDAKTRGMLRKYDTAPPVTEEF